MKVSIPRPGLRPEEVASQMWCQTSSSDTKKQNKINMCQVRTPDTTLNILYHQIYEMPFSKGFNMLNLHIDVTNLLT